MKQPHPLMEMFATVTRRLLRLASPAVEAHGLSVSEAFVLVLAERRGPCRASSLAMRIGASPSTVTGLTDRLVARGLLARETDPTDRRALLMRPTEEGLRLLDDIVGEVNEELRRLFEPIPAARISSLVTEMEMLLRRIEEVEQSRG